MRLRTDFFIFSLSITSLFATQVGLGLEGTEKTALPEVIKRPKIEYRAQNLKDPFQRPQRQTGHKPTAEKPKILEAPVNPPPSLTVQGLIWGGNFPQAIINNKVVKIGDTIEGVQVLAIDKDGVTVSFEQTQYRLPSPANAKAQKEPQNR